ASQAGWSSGMLRIPESMSSMLPIASVLLFVIVTMGLFSHNLYHHWYGEGLMDPNSPNYDALVAKKQAFLNAPGFLSRQIIFMGSYSIFAWLLARNSYQEDLHGGLNMYKRNFKLSAIFLVIFG